MEDNRTGKWNWKWKPSRIQDANPNLDNPNLRVSKNDRSPGDMASQSSNNERKLLAIKNIFRAATPMIHDWRSDSPHRT